MRKGLAKPELNKGPKLVLPVRTVSAREAHDLYALGHPIDQAVGYYEKEGVVDPDFYMMDRIGKLQALAEYKEKVRILKTEIDEVTGDMKSQEEKAKLDAAVEAEILKRQALNTSNNG